MRVRFWGTRGSLAAPLTAKDVRAKLRQALKLASSVDLGSDAKLDAFLDQRLSFPIVGTYGGNTPCVELDGVGDEYLLCDLGTGLREFGRHVMSQPSPSKKKVFNFFTSHVHWDHIMGFPFFTPAYLAGHHIRIHGCHAMLEQAFRAQHGAPFFPVDFAQLGARIEFVRVEPDCHYRVAGFDVQVMKQSHGGDSYGYRFEQGGKAVVYSTDSEHRLDDRAQTEAFVAFFKDADLVIFDAMYSLADVASVKADWGHSSNIVGVELCHRAGVKHYCMFHHEPIYDDATLETILAETKRFEQIDDQRASAEPMMVSSAYDGLEIEV